MVGLYLLFALLALLTLPSGSWMGVYRGTRAERDLTERRRVKWAELKGQEPLYQDEGRQDEDNNEKRRY